MASENVKSKKSMEIPQDVRLELINLRNGARLATAQAQQFSSEYDLKVVKALGDFGIDIQTHGICLNDGTVVRANQPCPKCAKDTAQQ